MPDDLKAEVHALRILRSEDAARHDRAIEELEDKVAEAEHALATMKGTVAAVEQGANRPWYKQAPFWGGVLFLPAILLSGKLVAISGHPEITAFLHKLLGTPDAVAASMRSEGPVQSALDSRVVTLARPGGALTGALQETFPTREALDQLVRDRVLAEIESNFRTVHISSLRLGLASYQPVLFEGPDAVQMDPIKEEERFFSAPPQKKVDIIIGALALRYDTTHISRNSDRGLRDRLTPEELDERQNRIFVDREYSLDDMPALVINNQEVRPEPVDVAGLASRPVDGRLKTGAPYVFKISGLTTGELNDTLGTTVMNLTARLRETDVETAWHMTVVVNLADDYDG